MMPFTSTHITPAQTQTLDFSDGADDQEDRPGPSTTRKRKRAHYSCVECSKRKAKCDRSLPCAGCVARRIPGLCKYLVAGYEDPLKQTDEIKSRLDRNLDISTDVQNRLVRLEQLLLSQQSHRRPPQQPQDRLQTDDRYDRNSNLGSFSTNEGTRSRRRSAEQEGGVGRATGLKGRITEGSYFGISAMATVEQPGLLDHGDHSSTVGCSYMAEAWTARLNELPERMDMDILIKHYFVAINLTRCPVREIPFMEQYTNLLTGSPQATPTHMVFLPFLFIVLAISRLNCSDPRLDLEQPRLRPENLYAASRRATAMVDATRKPPVSLYSVMTDFLVARYLILVRRASDAYVLMGSAIARAQSQGLHRDSRALDHVVDPMHEEDRRRIWQYVYHLDRYLGLLIGRPYQIQDEDCDVQPPSTDVMRGHVSWGFTCSIENVESTLRFILLRTSMAKIMARLSKEAFGLRSASFEKTLELDRSLVQWAEELPMDFQILSRQRDRSARQGFDEHADLHSTHRFLLSAEYNFSRITLHRPFLLLSVKQPGEAGTTSTYKESLEACYQSAMDDLWARAMYAQRGMAKLSGGTYRITTCAIILGIIMLIDPSRERLRTIRDCLAAFVAARREDDTLDEEGIQGFALLELIQARAESGAMHTPSVISTAAGSTSGSTHRSAESRFDGMTMPTSMHPGTVGPGVGAAMHPNTGTVDASNGKYLRSNFPGPGPLAHHDSTSPAALWTIPALDVQPNVQTVPWTENFSSSDFELFEALMAHFNST